MVSIYDNGSLAFKKTSALRWVDRVCISINTLNPTLQDRLSGSPNALMHIMKSVDTLRGMNIPVTVSVTISNANLTEVARIVRYFGEMGVSVNFSTYAEEDSTKGVFRIGRHSEDLSITDKTRVLNTLRTLASLRKRYPLHLTGGMLRSLEKLHGMNERDWICQALQSFLVVNETGDVSACHLMPSLCKIWDLPTQWTSPYFSEVRKACMECRSCDYLCYLAYSHEKNIPALLRYVWEYEEYRLRRILFNGSREENIEATPSYAEP